MLCLWETTWQRSMVAWRAVYLLLGRFCAGCAGLIGPRQFLRVGCPTHARLSCLSLVSLLGSQLLVAKGQRCILM